jgi:hypothetical protein
MTEYEADNRRTAEKTARLRELRLAKEAAEAAAESNAPDSTKASSRQKRPHR